MAFPLAPSVGTLHTEAGTQYKWNGTSWDVEIPTSQELLKSTSDPTAANTSVVGAVWRNTSTGDAWQYEEVSTGVYEWVKLVKGATVQYGFNSITQPGGNALINGDLEVDDGTGTDAGVLRYYAGFAWNPVDTFFDNSTALMSGSPNTTQEALDIVANRVSALLKGLAYYGTYTPATNTADFTASSGLTDGVLPAAGSTNADAYLIVTSDGTPASGPLSGTFMDKGDWIISDGVSWTHLDVSTNIDEFLDLQDTPSTYTGSANKVVRVNSSASALEFVTPTDTHGIYAANAPTTRTDGTALQTGDRWIASATFRPYNWSGSAWEPVSPVIVSTTTPTQTTPGLLWYNPSVSTMFVYDNVAGHWVGV